MAVKLVYSLDHGHGESCVSFIRIRDDNGQPIAQISPPKPLYIKSSELKVYSNVLYDDNGKAIDFGVSMAVGNLAAYFKRSPQKWDNEKIKAGKVSKTSKEVMSDFIRMIMDAVRANDNNKVILPHVENDECALYVGCPSDVMWTNDNSIQKYEELIREAAGIDEVHVVPESTAAIISMISRMPENALRDGVCVFDFGSSTADFTYIKLETNGKILIETSWTLGASAIEANIIDKIFADNEIDINTIWHGDENSRVLHARKEIKEAWFGDAAAPGYVVTSPDGIDQTIRYVRADKFGVPKTRNQNGKAIPDTASADDIIDKDFMDDVINNMPVRGDVSESGTPYPENSWSGHCQKFFEKCHRLITNNNYDCSAVILTGGASRMPFIAELCEQEFGIAPEMDASPSFSVANGLCDTAVNDMRLEEIKDGLRGGFAWKKDDILKQYKNDVTKSFSSYTYDLIVNYTNQLIANGANKVARQQLQDGFDSYIQQNDCFSNDKCNDLLKPLVASLNERCRRLVGENAQSCVEQLYPGQISQSFAFDMNILNGWKIASPMSNQVNINTYQISSCLHSKIFKVVELFAREVARAFVTLGDGNVSLNGLINPNKKGKIIDELNTQLTKDEPSKKSLVSTILEQQFGAGNQLFNAKMWAMFDYALDAVALKTVNN